MANLFDLFSRIESDRTQPAAVQITAIVAGLGNPGRSYERTRHNMGFLCIDLLADAQQAAVKCARFHSLCGEAVIGPHRVLLLKPQTCMNRSGIALREAADFYKIPPERVIVLCDDVSLSPGRMRVRRSGSAGGHNGLRDIIAALGTDAFPRIRFGIGMPPPERSMADWVTGTMSAAELRAADACFSHAADCLALMLDGDYDRAMSRFNGIDAGKNR